MLAMLSHCHVKLGAFGVYHQLDYVNSDLQRFSSSQCCLAQLLPFCHFFTYLSYFYVIHFSDKYSQNEWTETTTEWNVFGCFL